MICLEFKEWLVDKEFADQETTGQARLHMKKCSDCRALYDLDAELDSIIRADMLTEEPPASLLRKIDAGINQAKIKKSFGLPWSLVPILATAALVMLFLNPFATPHHDSVFQSMDEVSQMALQDHLRHVPMAFEADEVKDVVGWFSEMYNITFTMPNLDQQGYTLVGGRKCQLGKCDVVYLLYAKDGRRVSVFILPESDISFPMTRGQNYAVQIAQNEVMLWKDGGQVHALVI